MKKNVFYKIYTAAFFGICLIPAICSPFVKNDNSKEKRQLAEFPSVKTDEGKINFDFFEEFEAYFSEHFAFRQQLVNADGRLKAAVTATSADNDVIVGRDGWLYYGETVNDFLRIDTLSEREIGSITRNLRIMEEYCTDNGADFIFFSAPNKNTVYPENMPYNYVPSDNKSNLERLTEELSGEDFYFDMKAALVGLESPTALYHKTDTHWNNFGAYAAHTMLMNKLDKASCGIGNGWYIKHDRLGDLAAMLYPAEVAKDMQLHNDYNFCYEYTSRFRGLDDISITTESSIGNGRLLMYRDSYGEAILPYMAEMFAESTFSRAVPYRLDSVTNDDTVIIELVERNLGNLLKAAPVMEAPVCKIPDISAKNAAADGIVVKSAESSGMKHVYGILPDSFFDGGEYRIIIQCEDNAYEAFQCFEENLLTGYDYTKCGFSAYLPENTNTDNLRITVLNENGRAVYTDFIN